MSAEKPNLYVGCGLTLAAQEFKDEVEDTKDRLAEDWNVMQFLGTSAGTVRDVYRVDITENVGGCSAFLGIMDEPSWGLGWESREVVGLGKPTLLVAHAVSKITRLALATPHVFPETVCFERYENMVEDVPRLARTAFAHLLERPQHG